MKELHHYDEWRKDGAKIKHRSFMGKIRPNRARWYTEPSPPYREMERRVRQIERGQLRVENGLDIASAGRVT